MIAWIDGTMVTGSPEEIQLFREITAKTKTSTFFKTLVDDVPEHVKKYGKPEGWDNRGTSENKPRVWF